MKRATFKPEILEILNGKKNTKPPIEKRKSLLDQIPEVKPLPLIAGAFTFWSNFYCRNSDRSYHWYLCVLWNHNFSWAHSYCRE